MASSSASFSDSNSVSSGGRSATPNTLLSAPYAGRGSSADDSTPETWSLHEGIIVPSLNHSLTFANYLASQIDDDIVIRFHFATDVDKEITVHFSRLNFVSGPLAALARHSDRDLGQDLVTLPDCDHPEVFYQIRRYLYGQPIYIVSQLYSQCQSNCSGVNLLLTMYVFLISFERPKCRCLILLSSHLQQNDGNLKVFSIPSFITCAVVRFRNRILFN